MLNIKVLIFILFLIQFGISEIVQPSNSYNHQNIFSNFILLNDKRSLIESLQNSKNAIEMTYRINSEFYQIAKYINIKWILKSLKDRDNIKLLFNELLAFSEKFGDMHSIVNAYSLIGQLYFQSNEYQESIISYIKSLECSKKINDYSSTIFIMHNLATIYYNIGEFELSIEFCKKSLDLGLNFKDKKAILLSLNYLAYNYTALCQYEKAFEFSFKVIEMSNELNDKKTLALILHNIGNIYSDIGDYENSLKYNLESLKIKQNIGDKLLIGTSLSSIGMIHLHLKNMDKALEFFKRSLILQKEISFSQGLATVYDNLGDVNRILENYTQSVGYYSKALILSLKLDDLWNLANISNHLGLTYIKQKDFIKAKMYLSKSLYYSKRIKAQDLIRDCYLSLAELNESIGSYKDAYFYLKLYSNLRDSINFNTYHKITLLQVKYETKNKLKENEILKQTNSFQKINLEKQKLVSLKLVIGILILIMILLFFYSKYRIKNKITQRLSLKIEESLERQNEQKKIIFHQASLVTLGEYSAAIAHEINQPLQLMFFDIESLSLLLNEENIDRENVLESIGILIENMNRIKFITSFIKNFSSRQSEELKEYFDINTVVKNAMWMVQKHYNKQGINIFMDLKLSQNIVYGNSFKLEQALLNLLSNAKDAIDEKWICSVKQNDEIVVIKSYVENEYAILSVEDKGIGIKDEIKTRIFNPFFTTKKFEKGVGLGLSVVKEVIDDMRGEIEVESIFLEGTTVMLKIPHQKVKLE